MRTCNTCNAVYRGDSWNFCLNDGTALVDSDDEPTIAFVAVPTDSWKLTAEDERRIESGLRAIYQMKGFSWLEYDARFERLIQRYKEKGKDYCIDFIRRVLGRITLDSSTEGTAEISGDLRIALARGTPYEADNYLRENGYI